MSNKHKLNDVKGKKTFINTDLTKMDREKREKKIRYPKRGVV